MIEDMNFDYSDACRIRRHFGVALIDNKPLLGKNDECDAL